MISASENHKKKKKFSHLNYSGMMKGLINQIVRLSHLHRK